MATSKALKVATNVVGRALRVGTHINSLLARAEGQSDDLNVLGFPTFEIQNLSGMDLHYWLGNSSFDSPTGRGEKSKRQRACQCQG